MPISSVQQSHCFDHLYQPSNKAKKLESVGQEFEAILWRNFLESALKNQHSKSNLAGQDIQQGMVIDCLAQTMAAQGQLGIATLLESS